MCYIFADSPSHENILPVNFSVQQIIKHGAIHLDAVFVVSTPSGSEGTVVVATHFVHRNEYARYEKS